MLISSRIYIANGQKPFFFIISNKKNWLQKLKKKTKEKKYLIE